METPVTSEGPGLVNPEDRQYVRSLLSWLSMLVFCAPMSASLGGMMWWWGWNLFVIVAASWGAMWASYFYNPDYHPYPFDRERFSR